MIKIPEIEGFVKLKLDIDEIEAANAGKKVGEKFSEGFNETVSQNEVHTPQVLSENFDTKEQLKPSVSGRKI